jgi:hypothetical protein
MKSSPDREVLVKLTTEYWRLLKLAERTIADMQNEKTASVAANFGIRCLDLRLFAQRAA